MIQSGFEETFYTICYSSLLVHFPGALDAQHKTFRLVGLRDRFFRE